MTTKTSPNASRHMKSAAVWAFAAFALWLGFILVTARAGTISAHDLMIAALAATFVAMAAGSMKLMRRELTDYANAARNPAHRGRS